MVNKSRLGGNPEEQMFTENWEWRHGFPATNTAHIIQVPVSYEQTDSTFPSKIKLKKNRMSYGRERRDGETDFFIVSGL